MRKYSVRSGGGIGDILEPDEHMRPSGWRTVFEMSFYLVVVVFLLNVIFGIIFDTFGHLRDGNYLLENIQMQQLSLKNLFPLFFFVERSSIQQDMKDCKYFMKSFCYNKSIYLQLKISLFHLQYSSSRVPASYKEGFRGPCEE